MTDRALLVAFLIVTARAKDSECRPETWEALEAEVAEYPFPQLLQLLP